jgi:arylsulfatase A-like enzyme
MKKVGVGTLAALVLAACVLYMVHARRAGRPNVVLVSIDTLRADHLRCYGYERETSPFLDSLSLQGVRFHDAIAQANWTLPSHVSMLTSLYAGVHRVQRETDKMGSSLDTMAEILKRAGYSTAGFVDGGVMSADFGFGQGFDLYDDHSKGRDKNRRALRWIREHQRRPFFLFYHTYDVHFPYIHHPRPRTLMSDLEMKDIAARINAGNYNLTDDEFEKAVLSWCTVKGFYRMITPSKLEPFKPEMRKFFQERWPRMTSFRESLSYLIDAYDGGISYFDARFKKLWDLVCEMGVDKNTVLIVTSDHGECFLEHGDLGHPELLYEEIVRVPLIIVSPLLPERGVTVHRQVMSIDILPSVLDLLKLRAVPHLQGRSFMPFIGGRGGGNSLPAYADALEIDAVRTDTLKFIQKADGGAGQKPTLSPVPQLYNLEKDPGEKTNLAERDAPTRDRLGAQLQEWRAENERLRTRLGLDKAAEKVTLDKQTIEELRALGYLQ